MQRLAALALSAVIAAAGVVCTTSAASATGSVTVKGHVRSMTGRAVGGVVVTVKSKPHASTSFVTRRTRSSSTGRYEVHVPAGDAYVLDVTDPGDPDGDQGDGEWAPSRARFTTARSSVVVDARVHHGARLSGRVRDSSGRTVARGLAVTAFHRTEATGGGSTLKAVGVTLTRRDGSYRFSNLPSGPALVLFGSPTKNGGRFFTGSAGGSLSSEQASQIDLAYGRTRTGVEFEFPVVAAIRGHLSVDGKRLPGDDGVLVEVALLDSTGVELDHEDALTSFGFGDLAPGSYFLRFEGAGPRGDRIAPEYYADASTFAQATSVAVRAGEARTGLDVELSTR